MNASDITPITVTPFRPWPAGHLYVLLQWLALAAAATFRGAAVLLLNTFCAAEDNTSLP
jgi:hypothetical protein